MTVGKFFEQCTDEDVLTLKSLLRGVKGRSSINGKKCRGLLGMPFYKVLNVQKYYQKMEFEALFSCAVGVGQRELLKCDMRDFVHFVRFIEEELLKIAALETRLRAEDDEETIKLEAAGIQEMSIFEELNIVDELAGGDILKWRQIERLPYQEIYVKLLRNKTKNDINRRYQRNEHSKGK